MRPIWEGTTNVLSLDALLRSDLHAGLAALRYSRLPVDLMHESDPELHRVLLGPG